MSEEKEEDEDAQEKEKSKGEDTGGAAWGVEDD